MGLFVQDDYKVSKNLTLNLGLRWELDTPRWERADNRQSGFAFDPINPVSGTRGVLTFSGRDGLSKYAHDFDKNNFSPRFGFAYRAPTGILLRGGYALVYSGAYAGAVPNSFISGFSLNGSFSSPDGGLTQAFFLRDGMPAITRPDIGPGFGAVRVGQAPVLVAGLPAAEPRQPVCASVQLHHPDGGRRETCCSRPLISATSGTRSAGRT